MRRGRRWLALLLALVLAVGLLPTAALATGVPDGTETPMAESEAPMSSGEPTPTSTHTDETTVTRAILAELLYENETLKKVIDDAASGTVPPFSETSFSDIGGENVSPSQRAAIVALANARFISGTGVDDSGKIQFNPTGNVTREQVAVVFWRLTGSKQVPLDENLAFTDVNATDPFGPAVAAMVSAGLASGYNDDSGKFGVGDPITVGQVNTLIGRYLGSVQG